MTFRIFAGTSGCEKCLLSEDNGFLDEAFGNEREIVREPGVDPALERANAGDSFGSQQQRHPGAGRFVGSRTIENDVAIPGNLSVALFDLFHGYTKGTPDHLSRCLPIGATPFVQIIRKSCASLPLFAHAHAELVVPLKNLVTPGQGRFGNFAD